jgi:hypothetical protein
MLLKAAMNHRGLSISERIEMTSRLLILHLSDIHIESSEYSKRIDLNAIVSAIRPVVAVGVDILIVVTGDVAATGKSEQYLVAGELLNDIGNQVKTLKGVGNVAWAAVPGNHDVDFGMESSIHGLVRNAALTKPETIDAAMITQLVRLQDSYFEFETKLTGVAAPNETGRLYHVRYVKLGSRVIRVHCVNTAWMSRIKEHQGELVFPVSVLSSTHEPGDLSVALFHHPYPWLESTNGRSFKKRLEEFSDVILTGHEHEADAYERRELGSSTPSTYVEGAKLCGGGDPRSGFNVVEIAPEEGRYRVHKFQRKDELYLSEESESVWQSYARSGASTDDLTLITEFESYLHDPGAPFTHRVKTKLTLDDLWIDVALEDRSFGRDATSVAYLSSREVLAPDALHPLILVMGADDAGKTSLAKYAFLQHYSAKRFPLLLRGDAIRSADPDQVAKYVRQAVVDQYGVSDVDAFMQRPSSAKVLIIDDFDHTSLNNKGQNELLAFCSNVFERIVLTVSDLFPIERLSDNGDERRPLVDYLIVQIQELGHRQRGEMIERWLTLGREHQATEDDLAYEVAQTEKHINTLLGKGLFPAHPVFVLVVLQMMEASSNLQTADLGTYGYVYDALIASKLAAHLRSLSPDTKYTFLAEVAFYTSKKESRTLTVEDLRNLADDYFKKYKIRIIIDDFISEMVLAAILEYVGTAIAFKYKYVYYYFVAKYYALNLLDKELSADLRTHIRLLVQALHTEDAANVLLFLLYLTKDPEIIDEMLEKVKSIFNGYEPVRFEQDVEFLAALAGAPAKLSLPSSSPLEHLQESQKRRDQQKAIPSEERDILGQDVIQLNAAMKAVQILGQVLRNFPGSLSGSTKAEVATEMYAVGLRAVRGILSGLERHVEELRGNIATFLRDRRGLDDERLQRKTDQFVFQLTVFFGYAMLKRISQAIGSEYLRETYKDVLISGDSNAVALVDMTVRLDHFKGLPEDDLADLNKRVHKSAYATSVLRRVVWDRLYYFGMEYKQRQRICDMFDIYLTPQFHGKDRKKVNG